MPIIWLVFSSYGEFDFRWFQLILSQVKNTLLLIITVLPISLILWFLISYILVFYKIYLWKLIKVLYYWSLILPAYIIAILYSEYSNTIFSKTWLIFILILSTLPFSILAFRNWMKTVSNKYFLLAKNLWIKKYTFFSIFLSLLKPTILFITFILLAEIISEFWATYLLWQQTIMTWIYDLWFVWYKKELWSQISILFYSVFILLIWIFKFKYIYTNPLNSDNKIKKEELPTLKRLLLTTIVLIPLIFTFFIPIYITLKWTYLSFYKMDFSQYVDILLNSLSIAFSVWIFAIMISLIINYFKENNLLKIIITILYMIPGVIISTWILTVSPFINWFIMNYITLTYALSLKFLALPHTLINTHYNTINKHLLNISKNLWKSTFWHFWYIDISILKKTIIAWFLIIFIEVIKELPITMTLSPFWYKTLSMNIFFAINSERLYYSWPYILSILLIWICITYLMNKITK